MAACLYRQLLSKHLHGALNEWLFGRLGSYRIGEAQQECLSILALAHGLCGAVPFCDITIERGKPVAAPAERR